MFYYNKYIITFFLSMAPISELRLSLPLAIIKYDIYWLNAVIICIIGNFLICVPILYMISSFEKMAVKHAFIKKLLNFIYNRTRSKSAIINKYKYYGIILFVGMPFPFTGAWTGCFASHLFGFSKRKTLLAIILGLIISSFIVVLVTLFFQNFLTYIGYENIL
tara:strand:+ start:2328 stop:2816 length:489 start_codon:yes stop_codon:yes gene_type:complete